MNGLVFGEQVTPSKAVGNGINTTLSSKRPLAYINGGDDLFTIFRVA